MVGWTIFNIRNRAEYEDAFNLWQYLEWIDNCIHPDKAQHDKGAKLLRYLKYKLNYELYNYRELEEDE